MGEKESFDARQEAARGLTSLPLRPPRHEKAMRAYLSGAAYPVSRRTEQPQPVDEPAPAANEPAPQADRRRRSRSRPSSAT
jgi:hypothetical protein